VDEQAGKRRGGGGSMPRWMGAAPPVALPAGSGRAGTAAAARLGPGRCPG
jgi:hypothetical protein